MALPAPTVGRAETISKEQVKAIKRMELLDNKWRLAPGDVVSIKIVEDKHDALQQIIAVTGEIQAPYLGQVRADGLTCKELAYKLKAELEKSFFKEATLVVILGLRMDHECRIVCPDLMIPFVVAFGSIAKQGKFDLASIPDHKLSGLLKLAGGHTSKRSVPKIQIIRKTPMGNKRILVNTKAVLIEKDIDYDLFLRPDDVVIVE